MITKQMVQAGYSSGVIRLVLSPNEDGIACQIGDCWFYFGGLTAEEYSSVDAFKADIPEDVILKDIFTVLEAFRQDGDNGHQEFSDEYLYYQMFLNEHLPATSLAGG